MASYLSSLAPIDGFLTSAGGVVSDAVDAGTAADRVLLAWVTFRDRGQSITAATYNGVALTAIGAEQASSSYRAQLYGIVAPASGSNTLSVTFGAAGGSFAVLVDAWVGEGVDGSDAWEGFAAATGTGTVSAVSVDSETDDLVVVFHHSAAEGFMSATPTAYTERQDGNNPGSGHGNSWGDAAGAATVATSATWSETGAWIAVGVNLNAAGGGGTDYDIVAESGAIGISGTDAAVERDALIGAESGAVAIAGTDAALHRGRTIVADSGSVAITGTDAALLLARLLGAEAGAVAITGTDATLIAPGLVLAAESGAIGITGSDVAFQRGIVLVAASGSMALTGTNAGLVSTGAVPGATRPIVRMGLGGSFLAAFIDRLEHWKYWPMTVTNGGLSVPQQRTTVLPASPGWSSGDTLSVFGEPLLNQPGALPEGGMAIRLNGSSQYLASVYDETNAPGDIGPQTLLCVVTIHAVPGEGEEPAVMAGSTDFGVTAQDDGRLYGYYNGTAVVDLPFELDVPLLVVLTRSDDDDSPEEITLYVNGASDTATPANANITRGHVHLGKHWTNDHYLEATYSFAAFWSLQSPPADVAALLAALTWTDVTDDVHGNTPLIIETGIRDDSPLSRTAATGTATFALKNGGSNAGGLVGYYSPGHANAREGFAIGIPVSIQSTNGVDTEDQFRGRVRVIAPSPGKNPPRIASIVATDLLDDAARFRLNQVPILEEVRGDEVFRQLVAKLPNQPAGIVAAEGSDVYPLALDNTRDESVPMLQEFVRLALSERGRIYQNRSGALVYESRATRAATTSASLEIDDSMIGLDVAAITADALNRVEVHVHPRLVDSAATRVLFALVNPLEIAAGETKGIVGPYNATSEVGSGVYQRVGGISMEPAVAGIDYVMNAERDGSGADLTSSLAVLPNYGANGVSYSLTNTGGTAGYITTLQAWI